MPLDDCEWHEYRTAACVLTSTFTVVSLALPRRSVARRLRRRLSSPDSVLRPWP